MRYSQSAAVTPSDTANIGSGYVSDAVFFPSAGNAVLVLPDDTLITLTGVTANSIHPFAIKRVNLTGTTAANIRALKF
jgi:hypothetical protein